MAFEICLDQLSAFGHPGYELEAGPAQNQRDYADARIKISAELMLNTGKVPAVVGNNESETSEVPITVAGQALWYLGDDAIEPQAFYPRSADPVHTGPLQSYMVTWTGLDPSNDWV